MPVVKGDKSGEEYDRYMNDAGTERVYTNRKTGKKMSDKEFKESEGSFTESAAGTNAASAGAQSQVKDGQERKSSVGTPTLREQPSLSQAIAEQAAKKKATPQPTPSPTPKKKPTPGSQVSALLRGDKRG